MRRQIEAASSEDRMLVIGGKDLAESEDLLGKADVDWPSANSFEVRATSEQPAFLVLSVAYLPGWKAYDASNREQLVYQAQLGIMGSYIPAGWTKLFFIYSPDSLKLGKMLFLFVASFYAIVFMVSWGKQLKTRK